MRVRNVLLAVAVVSICGPAAAADVYLLDRDHSSVTFEVEHNSTSTVIGWFTEFDARIVLDRDAPEKSSVEAYVGPGSVDSRNGARDDWIRDAVLKVVGNPEALFTSTSVDLVGDASAIVTGTLSVAGVEIEGFTFDVELTDAEDIIGISARGTLSRAAIGSDAYPGLAGNDVLVRIEGEARLE